MSSTTITAQLSEFPIPPDICFMIYKLVPQVTAVCLSLTCKAAYANIFPGSAYVPPGSETRKLLLLLEKDNPRLFFCSICNKLHSWSPDWSVRNDSIGRRRGCMLQNSYHATGTYYTIGHYLMRLISNARVLGPPHGLPPSSLDKDLAEVDTDTGALQKISWRGRYVGNEIFLRTVYDISHPTGDDARLRQFIDSSIVKICMHLCIGAKPRGVNVERLPKLGTGPAEEFTACDTVIVPCTFCRTDVEIIISNERPESSTGSVIKIVAYRALGAGRTPFEPEWLGAIGARFAPPRWTRKQGPKMEFLKNQWLQSEASEA